jgi:hypothetical protein
MAVVTKAIDRVLLQQEPHPAPVLDRYWNVIRTNEAAPRFFGCSTSCLIPQECGHSKDGKKSRLGSCSGSSRIRWPCCGSKDSGIVEQTRKVSRSENP